MGWPWSGPADMAERVADKASAAPLADTRLKFIDMARSVAILLMLEGHFINLTLRDESRLPGHWGYETWNFLRGAAAPLFFTVAGLVFVYLLTRNPKHGFFENQRVKKGLWRALVLLFWGYALQVVVWNIPAYFRDGAPTWLSAFHVLQCIGIGLVLLIAVHGLQRLVPRVPLSVCYVVACVALLWGADRVGELPPGTWFPENAPQLVQNVFRGPRSVFPITPWLAFTMLGGALGALVRRHREHAASGWFTAAFFGVGVVLMLMQWTVAASEGGPATIIPGPAWFYERASEVLWILGVLLLVEHRLKVRDSWFMRIGRHTFSIYVLHVVILYGGIFGVGLRDVWQNAFSLPQAVAGAVLFVAFFILLVPFLEAVAHGWHRAKKRVLHRNPAVTG